jgi:hypothetical protein
MAGAFSSVALSAILGCALALAPDVSAHAASLKALAREKAAAVTILKAKAARQIAHLSADRVFAAYLNASTQGQGARLRGRMAGMMSALWNRFGLHEISLVDRSGELIVRVGAKRGAPRHFDVKGNAVLAVGFGQKPLKAAAIETRDAMIYAAPVVWHEQAEFVLTARQDFGAYRKVLAYGAGERFVVLVDAKGQVLADTRRKSDARSKLVAGLTFDGLRRAVRGSRKEGGGQVARGAERFNVRYVASGSWTIIAGEAVGVPRRCPGQGARLCG